MADVFLSSGHTLTPLVWELSRLCAGDAGGFVHWGATTQNIVQTGDLLVLMSVHRILLNQFADVLDAMASLAETHAESAMPARTHGQPGPDLRAQSLQPAPMANLASIHHRVHV